MTDVDVTECPDCGQHGHYDGRVLIGGRGIYTCPLGHRWQDADETPDTSGYALFEVTPQTSPATSAGEQETHTEIADTGDAP